MDLRQIALLLIFFIVYVVFGGLIFMLIEAPFELQQQNQLRQSQIDFRGKHFSTATKGTEERGKGFREFRYASGKEE